MALDVKISKLCVLVVSKCNSAKIESKTAICVPMMGWEATGRINNKLMEMCAPAIQTISEKYFLMSYYLPIESPSS